MAEPFVAIVIVNYHGRADTQECLRSLQGLTYTNYRVYLVDQASDDGTPAILRAEFPDVVVIENPVNDGFAGGTNRGAAAGVEAGADYLFLLNNDTIVPPDLLSVLVDYAETQEPVGIVGPLMLYFDRPEIIWSAGGTVTPRGDSLMVRQEETAPATDAAGSEPFAVDFIVGCGLLAKRAVWAAVGPMDARYFLYYEEADLCARARRAGWRVETHPRARLWHKVSRSTGTGSDLTLYYMRRNVLRYLERCAPHPTWARLASMADTLYLATVWVLRGERRRARVLGWALMDYVQGRMGKSVRF